jgi:hypothetical protein
MDMIAKVIPQHVLMLLAIYLTKLKCSVTMLLLLDRSI